MMEAKLPILKPFSHSKNSTVNGPLHKLDAGSFKGPGATTPSKSKPIETTKNLKKNSRPSSDMILSKANPEGGKRNQTPNFCDYQQNQLDYRFKYSQLESLFLQNENIMSALKNEAKELRAESEHLKLQVQHSRGESIQLRSELLALQSEVSQLKLIISAGESENSKIRTELFQARNELLEFKEKMNRFFHSENGKTITYNQITTSDGIASTILHDSSNTPQTVPINVPHPSNLKEIDNIKAEHNESNEDRSFHISKEPDIGNVSHQLDHSIDFQEDDYQDVLDQLKQIKKVLHDHTIEPMGLVSQNSNFENPDLEDIPAVARTVFIDKIYRTDSKDIIVQIPKIVGNDTEIIDPINLEKGEDKKSIASILKIPSSPENEKSVSEKSASPLRHVDANPVIKARTTSNPPPLHSPRVKSDALLFESNLSVSYQDILAANDRYVEQISAPEWKPVNDENNVERFILNQNEPPGEANASRSPSPTKSMLIRERDALEEELLQQYEALRKLLQKSDN